MKLTIDIKQGRQNNEEKNKIRCATKKDITGFYTEDEPKNVPHYTKCSDTELARIDSDSFLKNTINSTLNNSGLHLDDKINEI